MKTKIYLLHPEIPHINTDTKTHIIDNMMKNTLEPVITLAEGIRVIKTAISHYKPL